MQTITTRKHLKNTIITLLKISTFIFAFAGIFLIMGTVGASDNDTLPFIQIITQLLQGCLCCGVAWVLNFIKLVIE